MTRPVRSHGLIRAIVWLLLVLTVILLAAGTACSWLRNFGAGPGLRSPEREEQAGSQGLLSVVATTTIVGDVVRAVAGDRAQVTVLMAGGADPHTFEVTPRDMVTVSGASLVFANGLGLEGALDRLLAEARGRGALVELSQGMGVDPHVWFDPANVVTWTNRIEKALAMADASNAAYFAANGDAYRARLRQLNDWVTTQVARVPAGQRYLVTDHEAFSYFARRYGLEQVGTVVPGLSTMGEPSARELARLSDIIRSLGVKAIFVGTTTNTKLTETLARDLKVRVVPLYTGSLSEPGGPALSYIELMKYDVTAIVDGLR